MASLECGHKSGTPGRAMQCAKPRGRRLYPDQWTVYGHGITAFDTSLDGALTMWRRCFLLQLIDAHNRAHP
ncbi:hypothetical protein G3N97_09870 [Paraburkholderia sp. Ac-20347]|nr:hypothetical protein [Paraburkholderia sp. Ac-20347]